MFVEFVVVVILGVDSFFGDHHSQEDAFVLLEELTFLGVLEGEVFDYVEVDGDVGCLEYLQH